MDADRGGVVTRAEWRGTNKDFCRHDTNRDGVLSGAEVGSRRQEPLQEHNLGLLLVGQFRPSTGAELISRVTPLLDERIDDLGRLGLIERAALLDLSVHERSIDGTDIAP
jgi:hypothetical protein